MSTYLLRTKPQGEAKAIAGLTRCGHVAWTPTEERVRRASRHTKKKRIVKYPLTPRYVVADFADQPDGECTKCKGTGSVLVEVTAAEDLALARAHKPIPRTRCRRCDGQGQVFGRSGGVPWQDLIDINAISGVVETAGQSAIRSRDVARLKAMDGQKAETVISKALAVGQQIRVRSGPFTDHSALIEEIDGDQAKINVYLFGRPTPVTMPLAFLDPL